MPDAAGKLTVDEVQKVQAWLNQRAAHKPFKCPYCDSANWVMGNHIVLDQMIEDGTGNQVPVVPYLAFFCQICAYSMRFNAAMMGLFPQSPPASSSPSDVLAPTSAMAEVKRGG